MSPEQKGSIVLALGLLGQALAMDDMDALRLAQLHLAATFPKHNEQERRALRAKIHDLNDEGRP